MQAEEKGCAVFSTAQGDGNALAILEHAVLVDRCPNTLLKILDEVLSA
jgi:hypothetical protein